MREKLRSQRETMSSLPKPWDSRRKGMARRSWGCGPNILASNGNGAANIW